MPRGWLALGRIKGERPATILSPHMYDNKSVSKGASNGFVYSIQLYTIVPRDHAEVVRQTKTLLTHLRPAKGFTCVSLGRLEWATRLWSVDDTHCSLTSLRGNGQMALWVANNGAALYCTLCTTTREYVLPVNSTGGISSVGNTQQKACLSVV